MKPMSDMAMGQNVGKVVGLDKAETIIRDEMRRWHDPATQRVLSDVLLKIQAVRHA